MKEKTSYEVSNEELVERVIKAAAQAGTSTSGLVMDIMAGTKIENLHYLKGCLLARLDDAKPTIQPSDKALLDADMVVKGCDLCGHSLAVPELKKGEYTVNRVWYFQKKWHLELVGKNTRDGNMALYPADEFLFPTKA